MQQFDPCPKISHLLLTPTWQYPKSGYIYASVLKTLLKVSTPGESDFAKQTLFGIVLNKSLSICASAVEGSFSHFSRISEYVHTEHCRFRVAPENLGHKKGRSEWGMPSSLTILLSFRSSMRSTLTFRQVSSSSMFSWVNWMCASHFILKTCE